MRDADNIREVEQLSTVNCQLSIDWMGFIFCPKSSRYVSARPAYLPQKCKRVGVFVDENIENINQKKYAYQAGIFYMDIICEAEKLGDYIINVIDSVDTQLRRHHHDLEDGAVHNGELETV